MSGRMRSGSSSKAHAKHRRKSRDDKFTLYAETDNMSPEAAYYYLRSKNEVKPV